MSMGTPRCIDWGVLEDCGEAVHARSILGEDMPWTRLFELAELPSHRLITVEFLSTFRYRAHQATFQEEDDEELPPDIDFYLGDQHFEMSIERPCNLAQCFALYYASFYHRQERGTLWGGALVTHIACSSGMFDMLDDLPAIEPRQPLVSASPCHCIAGLAAEGRWPDTGARADSGGAGPVTGARGVVAPDCRPVQRDGATDG
ncbi:hypothetical protein R6Q57_008341 [Mikania cordata]